MKDSQRKAMFAKKKYIEDLYFGWEDNYDYNIPPTRTDFIDFARGRNDITRDEAGEAYDKFNKKQTNLRTMK